MANLNPTPTPTKRRQAPLPKLKAGEALPAYGVVDGSCGFRHSLRARERAAVDRALNIVGSHLSEAGEVFDSPGMVEAYLQLQLGAEPVEHFAVILLNSQHRAIAFEHLFTGTLTQTSIYPVEVVACAMRHRAAAVVLAHNHPSGNVQPSMADEHLTQTLKQALALIDVRVLDHFIVGGNKALSMAALGLM